MANEITLNEKTVMDVFTSVPPEVLKEMVSALFGFKQKLDTICGNKYITKNELAFRSKAELTDNELKAAWFLIWLTRRYFCVPLPYKPLTITYVETSAISRELHRCDQDLSKLLSTNEKNSKTPRNIFSRHLPTKPSSPANLKERQSQKSSQRT